MILIPHTNFLNFYLLAGDTAVLPPKIIGLEIALFHRLRLYWWHTNFLIICTFILFYYFFSTLYVHMSHTYPLLAVITDAVIKIAQWLTIFLPWTICHCVIESFHWIFKIFFIWTTWFTDDLLELRYFSHQACTLNKEIKQILWWKKLKLVSYIILEKNEMVSFFSIKSLMTQQTLK